MNEQLSGGLQGQPPNRGSGDAIRQAAEPTTVDSRELLRGARMIEIAHEGTVYRLQATRLGKLILTK